jgi:hypothetical protein
METYNHSTGVITYDWLPNGILGGTVDEYMTATLNSANGDITINEQSFNLPYMADAGWDVIKFGDLDVGVDLSTTPTEANVPLIADDTYSSLTLDYGVDGTGGLDGLNYQDNFWLNTIDDTYNPNYDSFYSPASVSDPLFLGFDDGGGISDDEISYDFTGLDDDFYGTSGLDDWDDWDDASWSDPFYSDFDSSFDDFSSFPSFDMGMSF